MTNFEYWKEELQDLVSDPETGRIMVENGVPKNCNCIQIHECKERCDLYKFCCGECLDGKSFTAWLLAEHIDRPKLTKKERMFCELVETGWIARDEYKYLYLYSDKPFKRNSSWTSNTKHYNLIDSTVFQVEFPFIKFEDEEPWSVEDLLKLEVEG